MAKAQWNATGHEAPSKQHETYTTHKCSSIAAKGGKAIKTAPSHHGKNDITGVWLQQYC